MMSKNKGLTYGVLGAGVAVAVGVGVLFVMPLLTGGGEAQPQPQQLQEQQPALTPEEQQRQEILNTPNTGEPGQPIIKHQELRAQDPIFDRYMLTLEGCYAAIEADDGGPGPNVTACRTAIADGIERWCSISSDQYHAEKCKEVSDDNEGFDLYLRADTATENLLG
jgi:hypothetical protein